MNKNFILVSQDNKHTLWLRAVDLRKARKESEEIISADILPSVKGDWYLAEIKAIYQR